MSGEEMRDLTRLRRTRGPSTSGYPGSKVAGVAGGLARHVDVDPRVIRVSFFVLAFFGAGLLLYAVCWLIVPRDGDGAAAVRLDDRSRTIALAITGGVAVLVLLGRSVWGFPWPLAVAGVVVLVVLAVRGSEPRTAPTPASTPAPTPGRYGVDPTGPSSFAVADGPGVGPHMTPGVEPAPTWNAVQPPPPSRPARGVGPVLLWYALTLIALGEASLAIADASGAGIASAVYPALALGVSAVGLLLGAFWGRAGGLILLGLVSAIATAGATVVGDGGVGRLEDTPRLAADVDADYHLGAGEVVLDLTRISDPSGLAGRTIDLDVGVGRAYVLVPPGLDVTVDAGVGVGDRRVFGDESHQSGTSTLDGGPSAPHLTIDAHVNLGQIEIEAAPAGGAR